MTDIADFQRRGAHRRLAGRGIWSPFTGLGDGGDTGVGPTSAGKTAADPSTTANQVPTTHPTITTANQTPTSSDKAISSTQQAEAPTSSPSSTPARSTSSSSVKTDSLTSTTSEQSSSTSSSLSSSDTATGLTNSAISTTPLTLATHATQHVTSIVASSGVSTTATLTGAAAAASTTGASSVSAGAVVGGVAAGIIGIAGLVFAVLFFVRRKRNDGPLDDFNEHAFKHQSVMLPDDGMLSRASSINRNQNDSGDGSLNMEQSLPAAPSFSRSYAGYGIEPSYANHPYSPYGTPYAPAQFRSGQATPSSPYATTPTSATPFMNNSSSYGVIFQAPMSPGVGQPAWGAPRYFNRPPSPDGASALARQHSAGAVQALARQPSAGATQVLTRQPSGAVNPGLYQQPSEIVAQILKRQHSGGVTGNGQEGEQQIGREAHYVDLNRSSVTPFQAQQYKEISHKLSVPPPSGVPSSQAEHVPAPVSKKVPTAENVARVVSPFADPEMDRGQNVTIPGHSYVVEFPMTPQTESSFGPLPSPRHFTGHNLPELNSPSLPSPAFAIDRVSSTPPMLPEIQLHERPYSPDAGYFMAPASAQPTATFDLPSPPPQAHFSKLEANTPNTACPPKPGKLAPTTWKSDVPGVKGPETVSSLRNEEDAYDGM